MSRGGWPTRLPSTDCSIRRPPEAAAGFRVTLITRPPGSFGNMPSASICRFDQLDRLVEHPPLFEHASKPTASRYLVSHIAIGSQSSQRWIRRSSTFTTCIPHRQRGPERSGPSIGVQTDILSTDNFALPAPAIGTVSASDGADRDRGVGLLLKLADAEVAHRGYVGSGPSRGDRARPRHRRRPDPSSAPHDAMRRYARTRRSLLRLRSSRGGSACCPGS